MHILAIESSCDDTSVALLDSSDKGHFVLSEKTASQIDVHAKYGGVVPEIAGRMHAEKIVPLIEEVLKGKKLPEAVAVTAGPGLITGLIVGVEAARTIAHIKNVPLIPVNHIDGHLHSVEIHNKPIVFPALALVVSGGHTELILMRSHSDYTKLGATKDDAAGECFDKVAKLLGFPYPGGPHISKLGANGNTEAIDFPRPMLDSGDYSFSFAGLKTAALYWVRDNKKLLDTGAVGLNDFCASFEQAIVDVLVTKTLTAAAEYNVKSVLLVGGVSANKKLRETLEKEVMSKLSDCAFLKAHPEYCMDNAAMIGVAGYYKIKNGQETSWRDIQADPNWSVA